MHYVTEEQRRELMTAGAVESAILMLEDRHWSSGIIIRKPWPYIVHYFNAEGTEVGYVNLVFGCIHWFTPPRVWHPSFLPHYEFTPLRSSS